MSKRSFLLYVPESVAAEPLDGRCITDSWWVVHPQRGIAFYEWGNDEPAPQCNVSRRVVDSVMRGAMYAGHVCKFMPVVFTAHALRERARLRDERKQPAADAAKGG